ncbi:MAG: beta-hydroxyacyl-ACP dehydratase [Puniceicoccales bacterium]|nr:beta-hydroxyacyl-ACP dehydratase [Puniceicoccales bacterium]
MPQPQQAVLDAIPHRPPFLFIDSVTELRPDGIVCKRTFRPDEFFYKGHYPNKPITPGVILCEAVFQAGAIFLSQKINAEGNSISHLTPVLCRINESRFKGMIYPNDTVSIEVIFREKLQEFYFLSGKILRNGRVALSIKFTLSLVKQNEATATPRPPEN